MMLLCYKLIPDRRVQKRLRCPAAQGAIIKDFRVAQICPWIEFCLLHTANAVLILVGVQFFRARRGKTERK
jgi:hypothetical protein